MEGENIGRVCTCWQVVFGAVAKHTDLPIQVVRQRQWGRHRPLRGSAKNKTTKPIWVCGIRPKGTHIVSADRRSVTNNIAIVIVPCCCQTTQLNFLPTTLLIPCFRFPWDRWSNTDHRMLTHACTAVLYIGGRYSRTKSNQCVLHFCFRYWITMVPRTNPSHEGLRQVLNQKLRSIDGDNALDRIWVSIATIQAQETVIHNRILVQIRCYSNPNNWEILYTCN